MSALRPSEYRISRPRVFTLYELWLTHRDDVGGLWVIRDSWFRAIARIVEVEPLTGPPPYYGNPNPRVWGDVFRLDGGLIERHALIRCPGTGAYRRADRPLWGQS